MEEELKNYKLQLQQVEAALTTDPTNDELLKLKTDLVEVIDLTRDLIKSQQEETLKHSEDSRGSAAESGDDAASAQNQALKKKWKVGDNCLAKWKQDGQYYNAIIDHIMGNDVKLTFTEYNQHDSCNINELKERPVKRAADDSGDEGHKHRNHNREYLKKKKQKKQQRFKQIEEERETEKNKWLSFNAKSVKKTGVKGKSIFASPENVNGRVGIGTCGISGKPMTEFTSGEKWKKGA